MTALEKLSGESQNIIEDNISQLKQIFPDVFREDKIDFDRLQEVLGHYVNESEDHYNFTWHGKRAAGRLAQTPSTGTLRPAPEESVDWENTQNLFIEGDNLEVLKLLQKSYHRKVKMIYIDPPYNTGNDFVYKDDFKDGIKNYLTQTGQTDSDGKKISTNSDSNGRYHTNWLNMMYPRLKLARNLLRDDGVIFISIDDNEQSNLKKLCDEIFGEENFVACFVWQRAYAPVNMNKNASPNHDFIMCFAKNLLSLNSLSLPRTDEANKRYKNPDNDPRGLWKPSDFSVGPAIEKNIYPITTPSGKTVLPPNGYSWRFSKEKLEELIKDNRVSFGSNGSNVPAYKRFLSDVKEGITPLTIWTYKEVGHSQDATKELKNIFNGQAFFDYPKPVSLINRVVQISTKSNDTILDFFAGSGTTAHAVMKLNAEDGGKRRHISVQLPEVTDEKSEAFKAGYKNIAEISKERIRRAGAKIKEENPMFTGDVGFKVFKLDTSNIKRWDADFDNLEQSLLDAVDYIKADRNNDDLLYELLLKYGLDLTVPIETHTTDNKTIYSIGFGALIVCLDKNITDAVINFIGKIKEEQQPEIMRAVFRDHSFKDDVVKTNMLQTLKRFGIEDIKSL